MLNRKEQVDAKTKGFPANWSTDVFMVTNRRAVIKNPGCSNISANPCPRARKFKGPATNC